MTQQHRAEWLYRKLKDYPMALCAICNYSSDDDHACHYSRHEPKELCIEGIRQCLIRAERREKALAKWSE